MRDAVRGGHLPIIKLLLAAGARVDVKYDMGTPFNDTSDPYIISLLEDQRVMLNLSGVISRGLDLRSTFTSFLIDGIYDPRLFLFVSVFAFIW